MLPITNYLIPFAINFFATGIVYAGILFISGQFLPVQLATIYTTTNSLTRTAIAVLLLTAPANLLISYVYKNFPASIAGVTNIISVVIILTIIAVLIDNIRINTTIIISLVLAISACSFLLLNLTR
ncbi:MAG TPA: hypothetical protein DCL21_04855 [Alphaproteobacteria bacterium]|nr:hypothetical protein [Alphaproteobacteria bacterium]